MLEKSRVIKQTPGERNFHIFYQLIKGAPKDLKVKVLLGNVGDYEYLNRSGCTDIEGVDDAKEFEETSKAMDEVGIPESDKTEIFKLVAAILHLGNVKFCGDGKGSAKLDAATKSSLSSAASLMRIEADLLEISLTTKVVEALGRASSYNTPLTLDQASYARDALAKNLYGRLFNLIVARINLAILNRDSKKSSADPKKKDPEADISIGVLDIYGFEIFENNSFEQLCINYVNERLQQIFIELTLKSEQAEYVKENIKWTNVDYNDNKPVSLFSPSFFFFFFGGPANHHLHLHLHLHPKYIHS